MKETIIIKFLEENFQERSSTENYGIWTTEVGENAFQIVVAIYNKNQIISFVWDEERTFEENLESILANHFLCPITHKKSLVKS